MRKNLFYIIAIIVLITGSGIIYFSKMGTPFGKDDSDFAVDEISEVTKIVLTSEQEKVVLTKIPEGWLVNKKFLARESSVEFLLQVLTRLKIKSPVSEEKFLKELETLTSDVVFVEVFEQSRLIKSFSIYKVNSNPYANYARKHEGTDPYVLYIPGTGEPVGTLFVTDEKFWEPYVLFNYKPGTIRTINMDYPGSPEKSFSIQRRVNDRYKLLQNGKEVTVFDTIAIARYLSYFINIRFVRWEFEMDGAEIDSVISSTPEFILSVTDSIGACNTIKAYSKLVSSVDIGDTLIISNNEVFVKRNNENELCVAKYFHLDPVIKEIKYFLTK